MTTDQEPKGSGFNWIFFMALVFTAGFWAAAGALTWAGVVAWRYLR